MNIVIVDAKIYGISICIGEKELREIDQSNKSLGTKNRNPMKFRD